jgi:hypothetical protein
LLAQDVCVSALALALLLEALKARQRSLVAFAVGFKNVLSMSGIISDFVEHHEYTPCTSHRSPSFEAEVMNVDSLKSARSKLLFAWSSSATYIYYLLEST